MHCYENEGYQFSEMIFIYRKTNFYIVSSSFYDDFLTISNLIYYDVMTTSFCCYGNKIHLQFVIRLPIIS